MHMPFKMDHNEFQLDQDLIEPIKNFIRKIEEKRSFTKNQKAELDKTNLGSFRKFQMEFEEAKAKPVYKKVSAETKFKNFDPKVEAP